MGERGCTAVSLFYRESCTIEFGQFVSSNYRVAYCSAPENLCKSSLEAHPSPKVCRQKPFYLIHPFPCSCSVWMMMSIPLAVCIREVLARKKSSLVKRGANGAELNNTRCYSFIPEHERSSLVPLSAGTLSESVVSGRLLCAWVCSLVIICGPEGSRLDSMFVSMRYTHQST